MALAVVLEGRSLAVSETGRMVRDTAGVSCMRAALPEQAPNMLLERK